jgi:prepilin-type N-terminal cleavage/methylation domain-containing protein
MFNNMKNGFTIIELVISIFILSVAIVGVFSAYSMVTILTSDASDRLTATYLAQEGMEITRNVRDTNWLNIDAGNPAGATWLDGLSCLSGCEADYTNATWTSCAGKIAAQRLGAIINCSVCAIYRKLHKIYFYT